MQIQIMYIQWKSYESARTERKKKFGDVVGVEGARLRRKPAGQVRVPNVSHPVVDVQLPRFYGFYVSSCLCCKIDHHRTWFHGFNHGLKEMFMSKVNTDRKRTKVWHPHLGDQNRSLLAGYESSGDDDVDLFGLFGKQSHLCLNELFWHLLCISTSSFSWFLSCCDYIRTTLWLPN